MNFHQPVFSFLMNEISATEEFERLTKIIAQLRAPGGCPWDREQTHQTLRTSLIEETAETLDAIERQDDADLREELGDLLMQPLFMRKSPRKKTVSRWPKCSTKSARS
jgi:uncharacterized protein YabN with tetrapyrrole methylase and pyrophosphatase domain